MFINQILTKLKSLVYSKSETDSLLNGKASSSHTHTKSQITDFPTIPSKVSQLTNDSGFITGVSWDNVSGKPSTFTPSSHTHTKSQITDFPAYGTTAGTICQGNDSRLSDARTPYFANGTWYAVGDDAAIGDHNVSGGLGVKALNSNTTRIDLCYIGDAANYKSITYDGTTLYMNGNCDYASNAGYASSAGSAGEVNTSVAAGSTKNLVYAVMADNDFCRIRCGGASDAGYLEIATADNGNDPIYVRQYTGGLFENVVRTLTLLDESGNTQLPGTVTAPTFSGNLNGNCTGTAGGVAWNNVSGRPWAVSQFTNDSGYITTDGAAYPRRVGGATMNFNWSGQGGQPTWLWGGEDGTNMYVYNPANFSVNYANNAGYTNWLRTSSHSDHLLHTEWDGSYFWTYVTAGDGGYRAVRVERSNSSGWADSAGGVAWGNVSDRPWAVSQFSNDSGFITSAIKESSYDDNGKYCLLHGDLLIQFGTNVFSAQSGNVTFKKAFSSAPIVIVNYGDDVGFGSPCCLDEAYTTYFTAKNAAGSDLWRCNWIAIGRA